MDTDEYSMLIRGYDYREQIEWDKFRTVAYFAGAADFKNLKPQQIKHLPLFDGERVQTNWERFKAILEQSKNQQQPTP